MKVTARADAFRDAGAWAVFIVHDDPVRVRSGLLDGLTVPFDVLVDVERSAYRAWGLGRAPWWRIWGDPRVWQTYGRLLRSGERWRPGGADSLQLGGDFIVMPDTTVAYSRPQVRDDRPAVGKLLQIVRSLGGADHETTPVPGRNATHTNQNVSS